MFDRITARPEQLGGALCIRGLRIPLATVVGLVARGMSTEQILHEYPDLEPEDVQQARQHAEFAVEERRLPLVESARAADESADWPIAERCVETVGSGASDE